jgi:hypothetical protein
MRRVMATTLAVSIAFTGCGTLVFQDSQDVVVTTNAEGAFIAGQGKLPGVLHLSRKSDHLLIVEAPGYEPGTLRLHSHLSWWRIAVSTVLDVGVGVATFWLFCVPGIAGIVVDVGSGAWKGFEEDEVHVELKPSPEAAPTVCPRCGTKRAASEPLCPSCDAGFHVLPKPSVALYCPGCGTAFAKDAKRCASCDHERPPLTELEPKK